jgi:hypothetical protein
MIVGHQVVTDLDGDSDHRPVLADFDLTATATPPGAPTAGG